MRANKMVKQARSFGKRLGKLLTDIKTDAQLGELEEVVFELSEQQKKLQAVIKRISAGQAPPDETAGEAT